MYSCCTGCLSWGFPITNAPLLLNKLIQQTRLHTTNTPHKNTTLGAEQPSASLHLIGCPPFKDCAALVCLRMFLLRLVIPARPDCNVKTDFLLSALSFHLPIFPFSKLVCLPECTWNKMFVSLMAENGQRAFLGPHHTATNTGLPLRPNTLIFVLIQLWAG